MGTVWLAHRSDGRFEGSVAIKLLNVALIGRPNELRFAREGSVLARLQHPNIARLADAGVAENGQPYLVLEYVEDGKRIDAYCERCDEKLYELSRGEGDLLADLQKVSVGFNASDSLRRCKTCGYVQPVPTGPRI